jgi:hypothetical protein
VQQRYFLLNLTEREMCDWVEDVFGVLRGGAGI